MKQNIPLQQSLNFQNYAQRALYKAIVLKSALTSSPEIKVQELRQQVIGKYTVPGYEGFAGTPALTAAQNTTGFAAGARFPGRPSVNAIPAAPGFEAVLGIPALPPSPAYAIGVAVPAFPKVPARPIQIDRLPISPLSEVKTPKIDAIKGWENAITIVRTQANVIVTAELPIAQGTQFVGSNKLFIGEITPSLLQAKAWIDTPAGTSPLVRYGQGGIVGYGLDGEASEDTLEMSFYKDALACPNVANTTQDIIRDVNGVNIPCRLITITMYCNSQYNPYGDSWELFRMLDVAPN